MAAKKAPAKKMTAPKKTGSVGSANAAEKRMMDKKKAMSAKRPSKSGPISKWTDEEIRKEILRKYNMTNKSVVSSRRSSDPGMLGPVPRKEYMSSFQDVVSESNLGTGPRVTKIAGQIAKEQWDRTFGPGKRTSADNIAAGYGRKFPKRK
jgi:hypothetical protein